MSNDTSAPQTLEDINALLRRVADLERAPQAWTRGQVILWFGLTTDVPSGWWICDGTQAPDGVTPPDMRGRFPVGLKSSDTDFDTLGETGGSKTANLLHEHSGAAHVHEIPHEHDVSMGGATGVDGGAGGVDDVNNDSPADVSVAQDIHEHVATADDVGALDSGGAKYTANTGTALSTTQSILPPFAVFHFLYRYV